MSLVRPHGASRRLDPRLVDPSERDAEIARAGRLRRLPMTTRETSDLIMLGIGAFTPLRGFMGEADWRGVCDGMRLADGTFWPIPITVSASEDDARAIATGEEVALVDAESGAVMGTMVVEERYGIDREHECEQVFRTTNPAHPGVEKVLEQGPVNLGGPVRVLSEGHFPQTYADIYLRPAETRDLFESKGWSTVAAFQTRNPMHRAHEYLAKVAVEICDGVLIHQLLGKLKPGDIPAEVRVRCIDTLVERYFVPGTCVQAGYPMEMRYAGPREALLHAVFRQNYGCSHLVIGRDHAGVGDFYGPFDAQRIFDEIPAGSLELRPLKIDWTFFCSACDGMASARTCPHEPEQRLLVSGTKVRQMLASGEPIDSHFSRPEVLEILREYYAGLDARVGAGTHSH
ncbi:MAG TPA: sulfate adenylyltransferase [Candidatus Dormibacteraeota bacterium]